MNTIKGLCRGGRARRDKSDRLVRAFLAEQYEPVTTAAIREGTGLRADAVWSSLERVGERVGNIARTVLWVGRE